MTYIKGGIAADSMSHGCHENLRREEIRPALECRKTEFGHAYR
jgi:hypothetical protein